MNDVKMKFKTRLEFLYFGSLKKEDVENPNYKRSILTGHLCLVGVIVSVFYIILELSIGNIWYIPYYLIIVAASLGGLLFLRFHWFVLSKFFFLLPITLLIALFTTIEGYETGLYMYFMVGCLAALTLFGYEQRNYALVTCFFIIIVFSITFFFDIQFGEKFEITEEYKRSSFIANFFISTLMSILMIYYLMRINWMSEKDMSRSTKQLTESRKRFELAIKGSSAGIWDWDASKKTIFISPRIIEMLKIEHLSKDQLLSQDWTIENLHPDDRKIYDQTLRNHIVNGDPFALECRFKTSEGNYVWVYDTGQAEWDENGKITRMVGTALDITERKEAENILNEQRDMLQKTNNELDSFVYSTSHDLRAPLSSILGLINIARFSDDPIELKEFLSMIKERVSALNIFIDEIIDYSRNSRLEVKYEKIALHGFMQDIISGFQYYENYDRITIENHVAHEEFIVTDAARFKVICNNLIINAIKYHNMEQDQPVISLSAFKDDKVTWLEITDNGQGINEEFQSRVFDMFFRASEESKGSGLGLYIVREMVEKIGGQIDLASMQNKGTKFTLTIPHHDLEMTSASGLKASN